MSGSPSHAFGLGWSLWHSLKMKDRALSFVLHTWLAWLDYKVALAS